MVARLCAAYFFVEPCRFNRLASNGKGRVVLTFFGSPTNVETARFIFTSLLSAIDRLWAYEYLCGAFERTDRLAFACGVVNGYSDKLRAERASMIRERDRAAGHAGTALALQTIDDRTHAAYVAANPDSRTIRDRPIYGSPESHDAGYLAGKNLSLSRPLPPSGGPPALTGK
jgi:hypothetical protein